MKENADWKMQSFHDLQWTATRRPQTAVWRIPKTDARREKYSKSAREPVCSYETHSSTFLSSGTSSSDSNISSQVIDLHMSNGAAHFGCNKHGSVQHSTEKKLPLIYGSADHIRSIASEGSSLSLNLSGYHSSQTYLTSVEIKTPWYMTLLHEKERCLLKLGEEINRLSRYEVESKRKDEIISTLRNEIYQLQSDLQQTSLPHTNQEEVTLPDSAGRLSGEPLDHVSLHLTNDDEFEEYFPAHESLESPSSRRGLFTGSERNVSTLSLAGSFSESHGDSHYLQTEAEHLHNDDTATAAKDVTDNSTAEREEQRDRITPEDESREKNEMIQRLQDEIQTIKKEYDIAKGAICSLQKTVSSHESKLRKSQSEKESLMKELSERAMQLQAMSKKFSSLREERKHEELMVEIEKENYNLRELLSELKSEVSKRNDIIADLKSDMQRLQRDILGYQTQIRRQEEERSQTESRVMDLSASEQHFKVLLETLQARFERFRSKIIQAAYTAPGFKRPQPEVSDNEILETMQKIIMKRSESHQNLKQKGVQVSTLHVSEGSPAVKQTPSTTRKKAT
ncbi:coiled-coil domain-containing protein 27 [Gastrophryne carolinensis]